MLSRLLPTFAQANIRLPFILCATTILASSCMQEREAQQTVQAAVPAQQATPPAPDTLAKAKTKQDTATIAITPATDTSWVYPGPKPLPGAILPGKRILAFYGNPLSKRMGILGELPEDKMLQKLDEEVAHWQAADPTIPVQPALHAIVVTAQGKPGRGNKYRLRMTNRMIDEVLEMAKKRDAIVFLDVQVGQSTLQEELPELVKYLQLPNVHLGIDAEFSMKNGGVPGRRIGTFDAEDINYATGLLANLVTEHKLPPKLLIVHRFTQGMIRNTQNIKLDPRYQVVMHMDGWGGPALKKDTYRRYIKNEPVQFTGFKLFYKNDTKNGHRLMTPEEVLALTPKPLYIQYQ
ncbi:hypothetical protein [Pontibacter fetidus]|uniref:Lipoprotein n=1 Tax=Pontibacter fetidus TaxID=2700082 RepID=A0A6B2H6K7_9BACT|nr:hypothetical protein [Pontibacter fetidus]NDK56007.1 hypothetical protein [Pontibacter fetidus]